VKDRLQTLSAPNTLSCNAHIIFLQEKAVEATKQKEEKREKT
jgi:hypothetical protein